MNLCVVTPTYNEAKNIGILIKKLLNNFTKVKDYKCSILVMDDNSPDGTANIVKKIIKKHKNIYIVKRLEKNGLGAAYKEGFDYAINKLKADMIIQMDADLSHNPNDILRFLKASKGYDVVIGSRYIPGGSIPRMPFYRKIISWGGNLLATKIIGLKAKDCTSGFRLIKTRILEKSIKKVEANSYVFLIELLYRCVKHGAKIKEIPIKFDERLAGSSKLKLKDIIKFYVTILRLRMGS